MFTFKFGRYPPRCTHERTITTQIRAAAKTSPDYFRAPFFVSSIRMLARLFIYLFVMAPEVGAVRRRLFGKGKKMDQQKVSSGINEEKGFSRILIFRAAMAVSFTISPFRSWTSF